MADNGDYYNYLISCGFNEEEIKQKLMEKDIMRDLYYKNKREPREITSHSYQTSQKRLTKKIERFIGVKNAWKHSCWLFSVD